MSKSTPPNIAAIVRRARKLDCPPAALAAFLEATASNYPTAMHGGSTPDQSHGIVASGGKFSLEARRRWNEPEVWTLTVLDETTWTRSAVRRWANGVEVDASLPIAEVVDRNPVSAS